MGTSAVASGTLSCLICEAENPPEAAYCSSCLAPMELAQQALKQKRHPSIISVVGDTNVGKTTYLGMLLDVLSKRPRDLEAVPKGVYSINLQEMVITHLAARQFPMKTASEPDTWHWAYYQVTHRKRREKFYDLVMPDLAGEALAAELDNPHTFQVIVNLLSRSAGIILLLDAERAAAGRQHQDFFALKVASYIDDLQGSKRGRKVRKPIAFALCKSDRCPECFDDAHRFAETNLNRLWNLCHSRFDRFAFFACSVVGGLCYTDGGDGSRIDYPLHVEPRGVLEPFVWVINQL